MKTYYNILDTIKNQLLQDNDCNSVTEGSIWEIDLDKQTIAPLSHIQVNNATRQGNTYVFNISVFCMDIVDKNPKATTNKFRGNDNEQDVLNTQLAVGARLVELMERGDLRTDNFALSGEPTFESFTERFENFWAGWTLTFDVQVPNEMTICDNVIPSGDCPDATYTITDLDGNTLYTGTIASGFSNTQTINDSTAVLKNSLGTTLNTTTILAEGSEDITAPNATVTLNDVEMTDIPSGDTENIKVLQSDDMTEVGSKQGTHWRIDDSNVQNSDASYSVDIKAEENLVLPDVTNTDSDGTPVVTPAQTPFTCTPSVPCDPQLYQAAKVMQTGQTVSYTTGDDITRGRSVDFFTLDYVNEWGHSFRFCGSTGGYSDGVNYFDVSGVATTRTLAFPDLIIFDFSARNVDSILSYYIGDIASYGNQATQITKHLTSTFGGLVGWKLWNVSELFNVLNIGVYGVIITHYMSYPPFDFGGAQRYFWTATSLDATQGFRTDLRGISPIVGNGNSSTYLGVWVRYTTLTELGL